VPRLLHPTGKFRNIRRFAFVIHPLEPGLHQEGLAGARKSTPKFVMDQGGNDWPPTCRRMVYCKMDNIVSPTGAEAEGWLISVGGTPKEMLARSPEFTYRRLLTGRQAGRENSVPRSWGWVPSPRWWAMPA
jgi:predicted amino acid dehydrogenase